jgi:hypothetical protein
MSNLLDSPAAGKPAAAAANPWANINSDFFSKISDELLQTFLLVDSVLGAQVNLVLAGREQEIEEVVADKGYHKSETLAACRKMKVRLRSF